MVPDRREIDLGNWRASPNNRFSFQHVSEFVPVAWMTTGSQDEAAMADAEPLQDIQVTIDGAETSLLDHLATASADTLVVMRDGEVLASWQAPHARLERPHLIFSISKSFTGMLAGIAAEDGHLDPDAPVSDYMPLSPVSAYGACRVRDLLDMTVDLDFDEEYTNIGGPFDRYRRAMLWNPERAGTTPETMADFLPTLAARGAGHGKRFFYASPNTDMLGLVIEQATGRRFHDYLAERILKPMGARGLSYVTVDRAGRARAAGGVCITTLDLARFGQLMLDGGMNSAAQQIIPREWVADMRANGDAQAWRTGNFAGMFEAGRYRSCWYQAGDAHDSFCAIDIHGQWLWIDPVTRIIIAKMSSQPEASDDPLILREISALQQVAAAF